MIEKMLRLTCYEMLILHTYLCGYKYYEIADMVDIKYGAIRSIIQRIKRKVK